MTLLKLCCLCTLIAFEDIVYLIKNLALYLDACY